MEQNIWTYRDPAPTKVFDTDGIRSYIANYFNGPAKRPLMIWCHNNPSIDQLRHYLDDYRREDDARLFRLGYPCREPIKAVLVDGRVEEIDPRTSEYPKKAFLPYSSFGKFFGFYYFDSSFSDNQFGDGFSYALGLSGYYRMPSVFLVNDYGAFEAKDQIPRQLFDHVRYLPTVKEFIDGARHTLETKNLSKLGQYVYSNAIDIAEGFVGDDNYAYYFERLSKAVLNILKDKAGSEGLSGTYEDGPLAVTREMCVGIGGLGGKLPDGDPELPFLKKFHSALQASKLAWMFDSSMPTPAEIAEFVGKKD